jgi:parvulin-like peptidyl-prolyl isomerase
MNVRLWVISTLAMLLIVGTLVGCESTDQGAQISAGQAEQPAGQAMDQTDQTDQEGQTSDQDQADESGDTAETVRVPDGSAGSDVVARIGDNTITRDDYEQRLKDDLGPAIAQSFARGSTVEQITAQIEEQDVRQRIFDQLIQEEVLLQLASQQGIGVDANEVDMEVEQQLQNMPEEERPTGDELTQLRLKISRRQIVLKMIVQNTTADMFHVRHILVDDEEAADEVMSELESGRSFEDAVEEYSTDLASVEDGGDLGWVPNGTFFPSFETVVLSPSVELNTPVMASTPAGYHVIEVLDREEDRPFDSVEQLRSSRNPGTYIDESFTPWYEQYLEGAQERGEVAISDEFDPASVPLPFTEEQLTIQEQLEEQATEEEPTEEATDEAEEPTAEVTDEPTDEPTATPEPTDEPTATPEPTDEPTEEPTATPKSLQEWWQDLPQHGDGNEE